MPARRRQITSGQLYELEIRAREGIPFVCLEIMRLLLASAMARTQRDYKVTICHFLWMGNHLHLLLVAKDAERCAQFYYELMKKVTDYIKRLLGLKRLELWEPGGPVLSRVLDLEAALDRIVYVYANPARAHLVNSISEYPGYSSWGLFLKAPESDSLSEQVPWVRQPTIPALTSRVLDERRDRVLTNELRHVNTAQHELVLSPNALYASFGIEDRDEIARLNRRVFAELANRERKYSDERAKMGIKVLGPARLRATPIMKPHTPKRTDSDRKVLFHTTSKDLALSFLRQFRHFCDLCKTAYQRWRHGDYLATWPPGAFRPPLRPVASALP